MQLDPNDIRSIIYIFTGFGIAFAAALWLGIIIWTIRDIRSRSREKMARILAVLVVAILFLPGLLIYMILRPQKTIEEEYQHTLEEEALLQSIEDISTCPGCSRKVQADWMVCPNCHTRLKKPCHHCKKLLDLSWNLCPYCSTPAPGARKENISMDEALQDLSVDDGDTPDNALP
jgi:RNA polymerase subunit RPABC4/transcription elongation factor Spt4